MFTIIVVWLKHIATKTVTDTSNQVLPNLRSRYSDVNNETTDG